MLVVNDEYLFSKAVLKVNCINTYSVKGQYDSVCQNYNCIALFIQPFNDLTEISDYQWTSGAMQNSFF